MVPAAADSSVRPVVRPLITASVTLGVGVGAFFDGIFLHQVLQWHHMLTAVSDDFSLNTWADGLFHVVAYAFTLLGVGLLWRAGRRPGVPWSGRILVGGILAGAGLFNVVEGVIDHHLLGIHHVYAEGPGSVLAWDLAFLVFGSLLILAGAWLIRTDPAYAARARRRYTAGDAA